MTTANQYIVQNGDNLQTIAAAFYGSAEQWPRIYNANRDKITSPGVLFPGTVLIIP